MLTAFPPVRTIATGEIVGANTWLNLISRRQNWAYGIAHAPQRFFRQGAGVSTGALTIWEGEVLYEAEHPTLNFSAEVNASVGNAVLEYYGDDDAWHAIATDTDTSEAWIWFDGAQSKTYDASAFNLPADDVLHLRFTIGTGSALVYRAYMSGTTGLTAWPTLPTFADGAGNEPTAADLNTLKTGSAYLYERACSNANGAPCSKTTQTQETGYQALYRLAFRFAGCQQLSLTTTVAGMSTGHVYVYVEPEDYNGDGRRGGGVILVDIDADETATEHTVDLSAESLTVGTRYIVEIGMLDPGGYLTLHDVVLEDLAGTTRANVPHVWAHGDKPTAAELNALCDDMTDMKDDAASGSPIWLEHYVATFQPDDNLLGIKGPTYQQQRFRFTHRWRWLRYRGGGRIASVTTGTKTASTHAAGAWGTSAAPTYTYRLAESDPAGTSQLVDLEDVPWLAYGMDYYVEDYGSIVIYSAQEEPDA